MTAPATRTDRRLAHRQTPALVVLALGVLTCLLAALSQSGHGTVDGPTLLALAARVVTVLAAGAVVGGLVLQLLARPGAAPDGFVLTWARVWVGALGTAFALELLSPASVAAHVAVGPDAAAATERTRWLVLGLALAALVLLLLPAVRTRSDVLLVLGFAVAGIVVDGNLGHAGSLLDPTLASVSVVVHALAASVWVGGLLALVVRAPALARAGVLHATAVAYSRLALVCYVALAVSGLLTLLSRTNLAALPGSGAYAWLILGKSVLLVLLGVAGAVQRRACLPELERGGRGALLLLAVAELVAMSAAVGLAVALTHTAA